MRRFFKTLLTVGIVLVISSYSFANNYALKFDGVNDYVLIPDDISLDLSTGITLEVWIYINTDIGKRMHIISKNEGWGSTDKAYALQTTNPEIAPPFPLALFLGLTDASISDDNTLPTFEWVHIAGTSDGRTSRLYVNGMLAEEKINLTQESLSSNNLPLLLGKLNNFAQYFEGEMDEARVWRIPRTQQEIIDNMHWELNKEDMLNPDLVGYWNFNEGTGASISDNSLYNNNGTLINSPAWVISTAPIYSAGIIHVSNTGDDNLGNGNILNPFATIQKGIDVAVEGDIVLVANGTYTGNGNRDIDYKGKNIVVKSENGPEVTIIDCEGSFGDQHRGFSFTGGETSNAILEGFTIQNGYSSNRGGGIYCSNATPKIKNCILNGNFGTTGGGIYTYSPITVIECQFISNIASTTGGGFTDRYSSSAIESSLFYNNFAGSVGGGIHCSNSPTIVTNCTIVSNSAGNGGGGLSCNLAAYPEVSNCVIVFNTDGGGVWCEGAGFPTLQCCDIYGNDDGDWTDCIIDQANINNNFSADPQFCDLSNGVFHISNQSLCASANNECNQLIGALDIGCSITGAENDNNETLLPSNFNLAQNYPNPFNPVTSISFDLPITSFVKLDIYNLLGQRIETMINKEMEAGSYDINWNGKGVASGIYFYRIETGDFSETKKMLLLK